MSGYPELKAMTRGAYDLQKLRIQMALRLCANFRAKLGLGDEDVDADDEELAEGVIAQLRKSYALLTEGIARNRTLPEESGFRGDNVISTFTELALVHQFFQVDTAEKSQFRLLDKFLTGIPIWDTFLRDTVGIGPAMGAVIITEIDIHKAKYPSSLWRYAGLDTGPDGLGRSRRAEHLVDYQYEDKNGEEKTRKGLSYNPFLKTKLMGVLAGSFIRLNSPWRAIYDDRKHRLTTDPSKPKVTPEEFKRLYRKDKTVMATHWRPGRISDAAKREMIKQFLVELHTKWRALEGLPVTTSYHEGRMGHTHRAA
jgi:hypothetical protein